MVRPQVLIIGGGVAGLCAAIVCERSGVSWRLLEASDRIGGRVSSRIVDGCTIDHGFAVLLSSYTEIARFIDWDALEVRALRASARVWNGERFRSIAHPLAHPAGGVAGLFSGLLSMRDIAALLPLALGAAWGVHIPDPTACRGMSTEQLLLKRGVSRELMDSFFRPFFGGVFLDPTLGYDAAPFKWRLSMFARGRATLPRRGMGAVSEQLRQALPHESRCHLLVKCAAQSIGSDPAAAGWSVVDSAGHAHSAQQVIVACDAHSARRLLPSLSARRWCSTVTMTWRVKTAHCPAVLRRPELLLNGTGRGPVNHAVSPTSVWPDHAPHGESLVSGSVIDQDLCELSESELESRSRTQMESWFGSAVREWTHVATERIAHALPCQHPEDLAIRPSMRHASGVWIAGDHVSDGSIEGAMRSGRLAAESACAALRHA
jgi:phytoene dehydrogenase-like protein